MKFSLKICFGMGGEGLFNVKKRTGKSNETIVVCYWRGSRSNRKYFLCLMPDPSMPLRHVCGIVCLLNGAIFNH